MKHNNSSAFSHQEDLERAVKRFPDMVSEQSVLVWGVDGGPDENPRFEKNIRMAVKTFQVSKPILHIQK